MCIRDRVQRAIEALEEAIEVKADDKKYVLEIRVQLGEPESVSYTHLRAHETVLELVCRLLLEKKKTNHNTQYTPRTSHRHTHKIN